ncbi:MAG: DUF58 domain-containing protein [Dehalococcoidales bacterium]
MTKTGFAFIMAGVFIYFLAGQTQIGWLYLFDAIIWALLVLSAILPWYSLRSLQVERQVLLPGAVQLELGGPLEDETVEIKLKVTNNGRLARHFIKVLEDCPFDQPEKRQRAFLVTSLSPKSVTAFSYVATCYRRGYYPSANITLQSGGLLGLMVRRRSWQLPLKLTVYPRYYQMEGLPSADAAWADWGHAIKSSAPAEFYGSREYQHGDPLRYIHWRNTARLGQFMLKEFEQASQGSVAVVFETGHDFGIGRETTLEYSVKIAASLAKIGADSGRQIDILAGETPLHHAGWREAMDYLAHLEAGGKASLAELTAALEPDQVMVAVVPAIETQLIPALSQLANRVREMVVVILEGFTADEIPHLLSSRLKGSNLDIISCSRGNLELAMEKLSNTLFSTAKLTASVD